MDLKRPLTTAQVPARFLETAMLIGSTPLKALNSDPRVSYNLYIPPSHYNPDPNRISSTEGEGSHPSYTLPRIPLIVSIHGTGRDAGSCRRRLIPLAESHRCAILAPLFPAGLDDELDLDSYKLLRSKKLRSDLALLDIIAEVAIRYPGIETERFFLVGFSGGGQFVHRFLYVHPERVTAASIGAPGRVTRFDKTKKWPQGVADLGDVFGKNGDTEMNVEMLKKVKAIQMIVGGDDTEVPGNDFNEWISKMKGERPECMPGTLESMRISRVETLKRLYEEWRSLGISLRVVVVAGVKHDSNGVQPAVERFLQPLLKEWWSIRED